MRFHVRGDRFHLGACSLTESWDGMPFMFPDMTESEDSLLNALKLQGQRRDTIIAAYDPLVNTPVIPSNVFQVRPYRLIFPDPFDTVDIEPREKTRYAIIWPAQIIGGTLELVITKRQMWLRSSHNNSNPNHLFWNADISENLYHAIESVLLNHRADFDEVVTESGFWRYLYWRNYIAELPLPDEWTDEARRIHQKDYEEKRYMNARKLIDMINGELPAGHRLWFPSREELDRMPAIEWEYGW